MASLNFSVFRKPISDPEKNYHLTDTDGRIDEVRTGAELMAGYEIRFDGAPDSYVVLIKAL